MKKRINTIMMFITLLFFINISNISAETEITSKKNITINGKPVYRIYDDTLQSEVNQIKDTIEMLLLNIDGKSYPGYYILIDKNAESEELAMQTNIQEYFRNALDESTTKELVNKIALYIKYGYGSEGKNTDNYYLATQQLIWEAINATGFYESDFYKTKTGQKTKIENLGWTTDKKNRIDLSKELQTIRNEIKNYYTTPSFCSSQNKIEIEVGETAIYTDNNKVLKSYEVICGTGIICSTEDNKLKVTASNETGNKQIIFKKQASETQNYVFNVSETPEIIANIAVTETISCELGIDAYKNVQTSGMKIIYLAVIGLFSGVIAYISYYTKKTLNESK